MSQQATDQHIFNLAQQYLLDLDIPGLDQSLLQKYRHLPGTFERPNALSAIYRQLLLSAQSGGMKAGVIGRALGGAERIGLVLDNFNPGTTLSTYQENWSLLLDTIESDLQPNGRIRRSSRSIWPQYCRTILSAARFLTQFDTAADFFAWADYFDQNNRARPALPLVLSTEIYGFGFALACDFLKELGYLNFGKPDVHIRDIFLALDLVDPQPTDYQLLKAIVRIADHVGQTPYAVDKIFWLIGSGYFYDDPQIGQNGRIGRQKQAFIDYVKAQETS